MIIGYLGLEVSERLEHYIAGIWFQQDGATCDTTNNSNVAVQELFTEKFRFIPTRFLPLESPEEEIYYTFLLDCHSPVTFPH